VHRADQRQPSGPACRPGPVAGCPDSLMTGELTYDVRVWKPRSTAASAYARGRCFPAGAAQLAERLSCKRPSGRRVLGCRPAEMWRAAVARGGFRRVFGVIKV
jgi:hypothetical protein